MPVTISKVMSSNCCCCQMSRGLKYTVSITHSRSDFHEMYPAEYMNEKHSTWVITNGEHVGLIRRAPRVKLPLKRDCLWFLPPPPSCLTPINKDRDRGKGHVYKPNDKV